MTRHMLLRILLGKRTRDVEARRAKRHRENDRELDSEKRRLRTLTAEIQVLTRRHT